MTGREEETPCPDKGVVEEFVGASEGKIRRNEREFRVHGGSADICSLLEVVRRHNISPTTANKSAKEQSLRLRGVQIVFFEDAEFLFWVKHLNLPFEGKVPEGVYEVFALRPRAFALITVEGEFEGGRLIEGPE
jgi:hypothetical protein